MADQPITHQSLNKHLSQSVEVLETTDKNGIKCEWSGYEDYPQNQISVDLGFSWIIDWGELKRAGINGLSGHITLYCTSEYFFTQKIDVEITANPQTIQTSIEVSPAPFPYEVLFEYELIPHRLQNEEEVSYDAMFLPSELNDTILVIDEKRLHVNKVFLSIHSDFFRALFSSRFKEGQMEEIPIKDVSYADFGLLMSTIYPETVYPNDKTAEKLLELADRFIIPSVIKHVEFHLLRDTRINSEKLIWMADEYGMTKLLKKCMRELNTVEKVKKLHDSPEYKKLSKDTKVEILDRLVKMV
ncbi:unnamed protein product [Caenorhabditis brenneri]